mmetsp:Transcript_49653/g.78972  ORF Transcript_49653/g.78972 Transcript_49653/m.78972 type:complete len:293 (-) Transcript_49653:253-1131(-)
MNVELSPVPSAMAPLKPAHSMESSAVCRSAGTLSTKTTGYAILRATTAQYALCGGCSVSKSASIAKPNSDNEEPSGRLEISSCLHKQTRSASQMSESEASLAKARHFAVRNTEMVSRHSRARPRPSRSTRCKSAYSSFRKRCHIPKPSKPQMPKRSSITLAGFRRFAPQSVKKYRARNSALSAFVDNAPRIATAANLLRASISTVVAPSPMLLRKCIAAEAAASPHGSPGRQKRSRTSEYSHNHGVSSATASASVPASSKPPARAAAYASISARASACCSNTRRPFGNSSPA